MFFSVLCVTYPIRTTLLYSFWIVLWPLTIHNAIYSVISLLCAHHWRFNPVAQYRIGRMLLNESMLNQKIICKCSWSFRVSKCLNLHCLYGPYSVVPVMPFLTSKLTSAFKIILKINRGIHKISIIWNVPLLTIDFIWLDYTKVTWKW